MSEYKSSMPVVYDNDTRKLNHRINRAKLEPTKYQLSYRINVLTALIDHYLLNLNDEEYLSPDKANIIIKAIQELNKIHGDYSPTKHISMTKDISKANLLDAKRIYEDY